MLEILHTTDNGAPDFLAGSGEMASMMRDFDWAATDLGPPGSWPQSLKTVVRIVLTSRYAMWMAWGPNLRFFCNDAYLPTVGIKRDWVLGSRSDKVWQEIWPDIGPRIERVLNTGEATWDEGLLLFLERLGFREETYHTFSYSPLADDHGRISGMLCVVTGETERVVGERRLATLGQLAGRLASARAESEVCLAHAAPASQTLLVRAARAAPSSRNRRRSPILKIAGCTIRKGGRKRPPCSCPMRSHPPTRAAKKARIYTGGNTEAGLTSWWCIFENARRGVVDVFTNLVPQVASDRLFDMFPAAQPQAQLLANRSEVCRA
jgi:hypothetical protein